MFDNLKSLLRVFSSHQFRASWQSKQMKDLKEHPLPRACMTCFIHDYSENYSCTSQNQLQSQCYSQRIKASIHVTVLHRHAIKDVDGVDSTLEEQVILQNTFLLFSQTQNMTTTQSIR